MSIDGDLLSASPMSSLKKVSLGEKSYYVKAYFASGRYLRRYLGRSRVKAEWENLLYFESLGLPTARLVAFGEQKSLFGQRQGIMVTEEIPDTLDLANLVARQDPLLEDKEWLFKVICQVADMVRLLHADNFIHGDLKWRNILVKLSGEPHVYFIDCPIGRKYPEFLKERGIVKDLACLDKVAKYHLSTRSRLCFYRRYTNKSKINLEDKHRIGKILRFFYGRE